MISELATPTYLRFSFLSEWHEAKPRTSNCRHARHVVTSTCSPTSILRFGPPFLLKTPRIRWLPTGTLRKWGRTYDEFVSILEFQAGSCRYVTVAVRGGSPRASRTWSQQPKFVQGSLEPVGALVSQLIHSLLSPCSLLRLVSTPWTASR